MKYISDVGKTIIYDISCVNYRARLVSPNVLLFLGVICIPYMMLAKMFRN